MAHRQYLSSLQSFMSLMSLLSQARKPPTPLQGLLPRRLLGERWCRQKVASAAMVQEILRFLKKLERDPTLRFVPA